jgi:hypothetical protein
MSEFLGRHWSKAARAATVGGVLCVALAGGCGGPKAVDKIDAMARVKNERLDIPSRVEALEQVWAEQKDMPTIGRETLKTVAWQTKSPGDLRRRAVELLLSDPSDKDQADSRNMMRLMVPVEPDLGLVKLIGDEAGRRGWSEFTGPLVRSYARRLAPADLDRPERAALLALNPGKSIEDVLFEHFTAPAKGEGRELERAEKSRMAAWEVLGRIDPQGERRAKLLSAAPGEAGADRLIADLRASARELRAIPTTASQLESVRNLRDFDAPVRGPLNKAWWASASAALAGLSGEQAEGLRLRHAEAVRWASANRKAWLSMDRASLLGELRARLKGRPTNGRQGNESGGRGERLSDFADRLVWADLVTILAVDEALKSPGVRESLLEQAEKDRGDESTEYGGLLTERPDRRGDDLPNFAALLYPPRPTQRFGDLRFVASEDMIRDGARALADYHFHAHKHNNADYAGPGPGDMEYALEHGRACVVFTFVRPGVLDVRYYHAGDVSIGLGEIASGGGR